MGFKALRITETPDGKFQRQVIERDLEDLPRGEVLIRVHYSSLNYKDALSATGNKGITKKYPHTPGVDAAGVIEISRAAEFATGEAVVVTGFDLGMNTSGGFSEYISVPANWVVPKPEHYTLKECMIIGTAGFTAAASLYKMQLMGQLPEHGPIVITGASGGVGSLATAILSRAGYEVIAITGKSNAEDYLRFLGATRVENRSFVEDSSNKALLKTKWAGAIDTVGGDTLHTLLKACRPEGNVVSTGLVASPQLNMSVYPFILNGVSLLGVGSAEMPKDVRLFIWKKLNSEWLIKEKLDMIAKTVSLDELNDTYIDAILAGKVMGRIVVNLKD